MKQYMLVVLWNDLTHKTEKSDLLSILGAVQIYYNEPDFLECFIYDNETGKEVADFRK